MRLLIVRHARTSWNADGRAQGHIDIPLDEIGQWQARCLAESLVGWAGAEVYSSDLSRCTQTAEAVAQAIGGDIRLEPALRERCLGEWEGVEFQRMRTEWHARASVDDPFAMQVRPENGESMLDLWARVHPFVQARIEAGVDAIVVSHGMTCSMLLSHFLRGDPLTARAFRFPNASITELLRHPNGLFTLERYGDVAHLKPAPELAGAPLRP